MSGGQLDTSLFSAADYDLISQDFALVNENGSGDEIVGAISGISSINETQIDFVFSVDALQQANVSNYDSLTLTYNGDSDFLKNIQEAGGSYLDGFSIVFNSIVPPVVESSSHDSATSTLSIDFDAHNSYLDTSSFVIADDSASLISSLRFQLVLTFQIF